MYLKLKYLVIPVFVILLAGLLGCSPSSPEGGEEGSHNETSEHSGEQEEGNEHEGEDEHGDGGDEEESNLQIPIDGIHDGVRNGIRLTISFDPPTMSFMGIVENTTDSKICSVRVEVHLSNGTELGPTEPGDLEPGEQARVELYAGGEDFEMWSTHPETTACSQ